MWKFAPFGCYSLSFWVSMPKATTPPELIFHQGPSSPTTLSLLAPSGMRSQIPTKPMSDTIAKSRATIGYLFVLSQTVSAVGTVERGDVSNLIRFSCSFAPTGLASSLALICTELYLVIRFIFFISPKGLCWSSKLDTLGDPRVYRSLSLLLLDGLTITSAAKPTNLLVDFVPFAMGAVVVLGKFTPFGVYLG